MLTPCSQSTVARFIDDWRRYEPKQVSRGENVVEMLAGLAAPSNIFLTRDRLWSLAQIYSDSIIESPVELSWERQEEILTAILCAGAELSVALYGKGLHKISFDAVLTHGDAISAVVGPRMSRPRYLDDPDEVWNLARMINSERTLRTTQVVCAVASGGLEPGVVAASVLRVPCFPVRYGRISRRDTRGRVPHDAPEGYLRSNVEYRDVLVVDDVAGTGKTLHAINQSVRHGGAAATRWALARNYVRADEFPVPVQVIAERGAACVLQPLDQPERSSFRSPVPPSDTFRSS